MDSIKNFVFHILSNPILVISIAIIIGYAFVTWCENRKIYINLNKELENLEDDYINSDIYKEAEEMYSEYINNNLCEINHQTFTEEFVANLEINRKSIIQHNKNIKNAGSNCILLGVLGTFIGLLMVLSSMNGIAQSEIEKAISGMDVAFVTSVVGVVSSIILNYLLLNRFSTEHVTMQMMLKIENLISKKSSYNKNRQNNNTIYEIKKSIENISESIKAIERFDEITIRLNNFIKSFKTNIEELDEVMKNSKDFMSECGQNIDKLDTQFTSLNKNFEDMFAIYLKNQEFNEEMMKNSKNINECVTQNMITINDNISSSTKAQEDVNNKLKDVFLIMKESSENTVESMGKIIKMTDTISEKEVKFNENIEILNYSFNQYLKELKEEKDKLNSVMEKFDQINKNIKAQANAMNNNFGDEVKKILGQFERYVYTTNKIIDKKLDAMNNFLLSEYSRI